MHAGCAAEKKHLVAMHARRDRDLSHGFKDGAKHCATVESGNCALRTFAHIRTNISTCHPTSMERQVYAASVKKAKERIK